MPHSPTELLAQVIADLESVLDASAGEDGKHRRKALDDLYKVRIDANTTANAAKNISRVLGAMDELRRLHHRTWRVY